MDNNQNSARQMVKRHKGAIQAIYTVCLLVLLLYIIFGGGGIFMRIIISFIILVVVTLLMAVIAQFAARYVTEQGK